MRDKYINVYNGVGALIATFSCDTADEIKDQHEQIYNPHVSIDEDNSTASFDVFQESDVWAKISGEDKIYEIDGRRYFIYGEPSETADTDIIHVTLKERWYELDTKYVQAYNVDGELEYIGEHSVVLVPFGSGSLYVNGEIKTNPHTKDNLAYYVWALLQGTGYTLQYCDVVDDTYDAVEGLSAFGLETEGLTVLENLYKLQDLTDCIFKWDTINQKLYVINRDNEESEYNKWKGYEIREGVNLTNMAKHRNTNIVTRVIPYGYDNLVISSVNGGVMYLTDYGYSANTYSKIIHNPDIQSPQALKVWATRELAKMARPTVEYDVDFVLRDDEDYAHETFELYDKVRVVYYDKEIGQEIRDDQRIVSLSYDVWKKSAFNATLGDKAVRWEERMRKSIESSVKAGHVISSSGAIASGSVYHGSGAERKKLSAVLGGVESTIAQIQAEADEFQASIELLSMYTNSVKGVKSVAAYDPEEWDTDYIYYVSTGLYQGYWGWEVSEWVEIQPLMSTLAMLQITANRAMSDITLYAKYSASVEEVIEVPDLEEQSLWETDAMYYVGTLGKFYKYQGGSWQQIDGMETRMASISATTTANSTSIALVVDYKDGSPEIKTASIVAAINESGSSVMISAEKINLTGYVTLESLSETGSTTIDGARITTGKVKAERIDVNNLQVTEANITGTLSVSKLKISESSGYSYLDMGDIRADVMYVGEVGSGAAISSGGLGTLNLDGNDGVNITAPDGTVSISGDEVAITSPTSIYPRLDVNGVLEVYGTMTVGIYDVSETLALLLRRVAYLETFHGGCDACMTCLSGDTCGTCETCQSGDSPTYDYLVGDTFNVYYDELTEGISVTGGLSVGYYDSDHVEIECVSAGAASYEVYYLADSSTKTLVNLLIGAAPSCSTCDSYYDEGCGQTTN